MSRQLEAQREIQQSKRDRALVQAIEYELVDAVASAGAILDGFSVRLGGNDVLVTLRGELAGRRQVCFVGGESLSDSLRKVVREAKQDKLVWRADKFGPA